MRFPQFRSLDDGRLVKDGPMSVSIAATWAWGVSLFVGMQVALEKGLDVFIVWSLANATALVVFAWVASRFAPGMRLLSTLVSRAPVYAVAAPVMQFISALVNLTALRYVLNLLGIADAWWTWVMVAVVAYVLVGGFSWVVSSHLVQYSIWMLALVAGCLIGGELSPVKIGLSDHWPWALWSFAMFSSGPFLDQQLWQRWFRSKSQALRTWTWGAGLFLLYLSVVGLAAVRGVPGWSLAIAGFFVAMSTLKSITEAVGSFARGPGARIVVIGIFALAVAVVITHDIDLITFWTTYASVRVILALAVVAGLLWARRPILNAGLGG